MVQDREFSRSIIFNEMDPDNQNFWFDFKKLKFLHNIDTFYYSVKFANDFTSSSEEPAVQEFRKYFKHFIDVLDSA